MGFTDLLPDLRGRWMIRFRSDHDVDLIDLNADHVKGLVLLLHYPAGRAGRYFSDEETRHRHLAWVLGSARRSSSLTSLEVINGSTAGIAVQIASTSLRFYPFTAQTHPLLLQAATP